MQFCAQVSSKQPRQLCLWRGSCAARNLHLIAAPQGLSEGEFGDLESLAMNATAAPGGGPKPGAAWLECNNIPPEEMLIRALHEVCHLLDQCDRGKNINEVNASRCAEDRLKQVAPKYAAYQVLLREKVQLNVGSRTE